MTSWPSSAGFLLPETGASRNRPPFSVIACNLCPRGKGITACSSAQSSTFEVLNKRTSSDLIKIRNSPLVLRSKAIKTCLYFHSHSAYEIVHVTFILCIASFQITRNECEGSEKRVLLHTLLIVIEVSASTVDMSTYALPGIIDSTTPPGPNATWSRGKPSMGWSDLSSVSFSHWVSSSRLSPNPAHEWRPIRSAQIWMHKVELSTYCQGNCWISKHAESDFRLQYDFSRGFGGRGTHRHQSIALQKQATIRRS